MTLLIFAGSCYHGAGAYIPAGINERKSGVFVTNCQNIAILVGCRKWTFQARRQDSVTEGAEINFERAREVYLCEFERSTGAREIYPILDQMKKGFLAEIGNSSGFPGRKQVISKKKRLH